MDNGYGLLKNTDPSPFRIKFSPCVHVLLPESSALDPKNFKNFCDGRGGGERGAVKGGFAGSHPYLPVRKNTSESTI